MATYGKPMAGSWLGGAPDSTRPHTGVRRSLVLATAAVLCLAILSLRLELDAETDAIGSMYALPVALVALTMGRWAGLAAGLVAVGLFLAGRSAVGLPIDEISVATHFVTLVGLGAGLGQIADRLRAASQLRDERERELEASQRRLREAHQAAKLGSWEWDVENDVVTWSETLYPLLELDPSSFTPSVTSFLEVVHRDDSARVEAVLRNAVESKKPFSYRARIVVPSGNERVVEVTGQTLVPPAGSHGRMVGTLQDVTERAATEEAHATLEHRLNQFERLESIGKLAGGIAHDFNNLLAVILNYAALADQELGDSPARDEIREITKAAERAAALTRQLLIFSRRDVVQPEVLDLNEIVGETRTMLARTLGEDVSLVTSLADTDCAVKADRSQLEQVLINLAVNARDAMPDGGRLTIETDKVTLDEVYFGSSGALQPGAYVRLKVSDTGEGIPREVIDHIFEPFFTTKPTGRGTGLGLATVYGIVHEAGGGISVYSEPGRGSVFRVHLPAAREPASARQAERPGERQGGTETILVVEDEEGVRRVMTRVLATAGYDVIEAHDGECALERIREEGDRVDLVITDVVMPGISGKQLAEHVRESRPDTKILFSSGYADDVMLRHGISEQRFSFLEKPFTAAGLLSATRNVLDDDRSAGGQRD